MGGGDPWTGQQNPDYPDYGLGYGDRKGHQPMGGGDPWTGQQYPDYPDYGPASATSHFLLMHQMPPPPPPPPGPPVDLGLLLLRGGLILEQLKSDKHLMKKVERVKRAVLQGICEGFVPDSTSSADPMATYSGEATEEAGEDEEVAMAMHKLFASKGPPPPPPSPKVPISELANGILTVERKGK